MGAKGAISAYGIYVLRGESRVGGSFELHADTMRKFRNGRLSRGRWYSACVEEIGQRCAFGDLKLGFSYPLCKATRKEVFVGGRSAKGDDRVGRRVGGCASEAVEKVANSVACGTTS